MPTRGRARPHSGRWLHHDDDCLCAVAGARYCNRDGWVWSCCGACKRDSECAAPNTHPTHWSHPAYSKTIAGWQGDEPIYLDDEALRRLAPDCFLADEEPDPTPGAG